jgi:hypothetical protein
MLALIVLLLSVYNLWQILGALRGLREFQLPFVLWGFWLASALLGVIVAVFLYFPGLAPPWSLLRLPIAFFWFMPAIAAGMAVERKLQLIGTARTERLEKIASSTMYLGIVTVGILIAAYVYTLMIIEAGHSTGLPRL